MNEYLAEFFLDWRTLQKEALEKSILLFEIIGSSGRIREAKETADGQNVILCHTDAISVPCICEKSTNVECDLQADVWKLRNMQKINCQGGCVVCHEWVVFYYSILLAILIWVILVCYFNASNDKQSDTPHIYTVVCLTVLIITGITCILLMLI
jgi:hypothetical protein